MGTPRAETNVTADCTFRPRPSRRRRSSKTEVAHNPVHAVFFSNRSRALRLPVNPKLCDTCSGTDISVKAEGKAPRQMQAQELFLTFLPLREGPGRCREATSAWSPKSRGRWAVRYCLGSGRLRRWPSALLKHGGSGQRFGAG